MIKTLQEWRDIIEYEKDFVYFKPYSNTIINTAIRAIAKNYSVEAANEAIEDFELENLGWKKIPIPPAIMPEHLMIQKDLLLDD